MILGAQKNRLIEKTLFSTNYMYEMTREIIDLRIIYPTKHKKAGQGRPAHEMPFEWRFASGPILVRHCVLAGFIC